MIRAALGVPLVDRSGGVGWLGIFSRDPQARFGDDDLRRAEELAERVAPALENARRFQEARQLADLDALTGLHNRRYFHETLAREVARAHRYSRGLGLVIVDIDDFKGVNDTTRPSPRARVRSPRLRNVSARGGARVRHSVPYRRR